MKNFQQKAVDELQIDRTITAPSITSYMVTDLFTFRPDTPITDVIDTLLENNITGAPVLNDLNEVVGLIDDKDCLNVLFGGVYHNSPVPVSDDTVAAYMSNVMKTITIHADIFEVANIFLTTPYKRLLVMDDNGKLAGQISRRDILRAIKDMEIAKN